MHAFHERDRGVSTSRSGVSVIADRALSYPAHWHHEIEVVRVRRGTIEVTTDAGSTVLRARQAMFVPGGCVHSYRSSPRAVADVAMLPEVLLGPTAPPAELTRPIVTRARRGSAGTNASIAALFDQVVDETRAPAGATDLAVRGALCQVCALFARDGAPLRAPEGNSSNRSAKAHLVRVRRGIEYTRERFRDNLCLDTVAAQANLSYFHFSRLFREATGTGFRTYLTSLRIAEADRLLAESEMGVADIAFASGFNSISAFNRAYRRVRGRAPRGR